MSRRERLAGLLVMVLCVVGLRPGGVDAGGAGPRDCRRLIPVVVGGDRTTMGRAIAIVAKGVRDPRIRPSTASPRQLHALIDCLAPRWGVSAHDMHAVAECESGNGRAEWPTDNPMANAQYDDGTYMNAFNYDLSTWRSSSAAYGHPGADPLDPYAQVDTTARKVSREGWDAWGICI